MRLEENVNNYTFLHSFFCHQLPERSFFLFGEKSMYSLREIQSAWQDTLNPMILRQFIATAGRIAALSDDVSLRFDPVVGAASAATAPLSARLAMRAQETGIAIAPQEGSASMTMKGFFSAITDNGTTTVIYVWDVIDPEGNRLHRIQGQQPAPAGGSQGWDAVTDATMQAIADETMNQLVAWLAIRQG